MLWIVEGWNEYNNENTQFIVESLTKPTADECNLVGIIEGLIGEGVSFTWSISIFQPFEIPKKKSEEYYKDRLDLNFNLEVGDIYRIVDETGKIEYFTVRAIKPGYQDKLMIWHSLNSDNTGECHDYKEIKFLWEQEKVFINKKEVKSIN